MGAAKITHQLGCSLGNKSTCLTEFFRIGNAVIGFIGLAQAGEFIRMGQPIKFATVHNGAAHAGAMTIHIFSGGMSYNIGTPFNGTTVDGCGEGIIHDEGYAVAMSGLGEFFDI